MAKSRKIKVLYRKLGKEAAYGICHHDDCIEIDSRIKGKKKFEILLHECLHFVNPTDTEEEIIKKSVLITNTFWHEGIAWIDRDNSEPLQDGKR
jgi:hypothetical protein